MKYEIYGVYLVDFKSNIGGELSGKHYAVVVNKLIKPDNTLVVIPLTSKKEGKKYREGITINCLDYQNTPSKNKAFIRVNKIREVSTNRIYGRMIYKLNNKDIDRLKNSMENILINR